MDIQKVKEKIDQAKVVSFDVFDTLIFRITSSPEVIFDFVGEQFGMDGFRNIRIKSQQEISRIILKSGKAPHANIDEIYDYIAKKHPGYAWEEAKKLEINMEKDAVFCNKEIFEIYQYALEKGKRVIAVSDMYFDGTMIKEMLDDCGYNGIAKIYSSADLKKTKYERTIFAEV